MTAWENEICPALRIYIKESGFKRVHHGLLCGCCDWQVYLESFIWQTGELPAVVREQLGRLDWRIEADFTRPLYLLPPIDSLSIYM